MSNDRRGAPVTVQLPRTNLSDLARAVERELADCTRQNQEARFPQLILLAPNGAGWRLTVNNAGALVTSQVVP